MSHGYGAQTSTAPYALVAEFDSADALLAAAEASRKEGYRKMDTYTPFPIHGMSEAIGFSDQKMPWIIFAAGLTGALALYSLQWYTSVIDYPLNVGGKPLNSIPAFIPITFEGTVLFAGIAAVVGMLALNGLPRPYHSIFNTPDFERASQDRFFLAIEAKDPRYEVRETRAFLETLSPVAVSEVTV